MTENIKDDVKHKISGIGGVFESFFDSVYKTVEESKKTIDSTTKKNIKELESKIESLQKQISTQFEKYKREAEMQFCGQNNHLVAVEKNINEKSDKIKREIESIESKLVTQFEELKITLSANLDKKTNILEVEINKLKDGVFKSLDIFKNIYK